MILNRVPHPRPPGRNARLIRAPELEVARRRRFCLVAFAGTTERLLARDLVGPEQKLGSPAGSPRRVQAASRERVDAFYAAAIAAGGTDNGRPGVRQIHHPDYYRAYVLDPDGNNIEAVCHSAA